MVLQSPMRKRRIVPLASLALVTACGTDLMPLANRLTTVEERAFPRTYLQLLADAHLDSAFSLLSPELRTDTTRIGLRQVAGLLKDARLDSMRLIGANVTTFGGDSRDVNLSYEMPMVVGGGWLMSNVATRRAGQTFSVIGFSGRPIPGPLEVLNRFSLSGKSLIHYVWLTLALIIPLVTITVAAIVWRARGMPRRWLWVFGSLIATPAFFINWTTGEVGVQSAFFLLFGGAATSAGPAAPWVVSFALPIGALVAYLKMLRWRQATASGTARGGTTVAA